MVLRTLRNVGENHTLHLISNLLISRSILILKVIVHLEAVVRCFHFYTDHPATFRARVDAQLNLVLTFLERKNSATNDENDKYT